MVAHVLVWADFAHEMLLGMNLDFQNRFRARLEGTGLNLTFRRRPESLFADDNQTA